MSALFAEATEPPAAQAAHACELFIVFNPGSGSQDKADARAIIERTLQGAGRRHRFVPVQRGDVHKACAEAARLAKAHDGAIVAAGGDGTINAAAQAAYTEDCVLGVIAQGTFNMFARDHGLPLDVEEATAAVLDGRPSPVQVGTINQRVFLVNASLGLYPKLLADREEMKERFGRKRWVAILSALKSLFDWRTRLALEIELDGHLTRVVTPGLFVGNNRMQLERIGIAASVSDHVGHGWLAGIASKRLDTWAKLRLAADGLLGRLGDAPEITAVRLKSLTVGNRHARRVRVALDGEVCWMDLPLRIAVAPRPLRLLQPPTLPGD
jgi:diacylglycerol kinase family enzyme